MELDLVAKRVCANTRLTGTELRFPGHAFSDIAPDHSFGPSQSRWALLRLPRFFLSLGMIEAQARRGQGWKEPITHLIAVELFSRLARRSVTHAAAPVCRFYTTLPVIPCPVLPRLPPPKAL